VSFFFRIVFKCIEFTLVIIIIEYLLYLLKKYNYFFPKKKGFLMIEEIKIGWKK